MTQATHNCTGCPVSAGTHKPADAVHLIIEPAAELTDQQIDDAFARMPDGAQGFLKSWGYRQFAREIAALAATPAAPVDPMDWPLPCDVTVGHGTMRKGVKLRTLVLRMKGLYQMATGHDADEVAERTPEQRAQVLADFQARIGATTQTGVPAAAPDARDAITERGWICKHEDYGTWFMPWSAVAEDYKHYLIESGDSTEGVAEEAINTWWLEQCGWLEVSLHGRQLERADMVQHEAWLLKKMARDLNMGVDDAEEINSPAIAAQAGKGVA